MEKTLAQSAAIAQAVELLLANTNVQPLTCTLIQKLASHLPVSWEEEQAFGITSAQHYHVLRMMILEAVVHGQLVQVAQELDQAASDGAAITALAAHYQPQCIGLTFETFFDFLCQVDGQERQLDW